MAPKGRWSLGTLELRVVQGASALWRAIAAGNHPLDHDCYMKMFQLDSLLATFEVRADNWVGSAAIHGGSCGNPPRAAHTQPLLVERAFDGTLSHLLSDRT